MEVGRYCQVNFQEDGTSEMYMSFGKDQVDKRVRELEQGKKAVQEEEVMISPAEVNRTSNLTTKLYLLELVDKEGRRQWGIMGRLPSVKYRELKKEFSPAIQEVWTSLTSRPSGVVVDLLVGSESISLHPVCLET